MSLWTRLRVSGQIGSAIVPGDCQVLRSDALRTASYLRRGSRIRTDAGRMNRPEGITVSTRAAAEIEEEFRGVRQGRDDRFDVGWSVERNHVPIRNRGQRRIGGLPWVDQMER